jgi:hypothetical protein
MSRMDMHLDAEKQVYTINWHDIKASVAWNVLRLWLSKVLMSVKIMYY